jgi:protease-4
MKLLSKLNPFKKQEAKPRTKTSEVLDHHLEKAVRIFGISHLTKTMMVFGFFVFAIMMGWFREAGDLNRGDYISQVKLEGAMTESDGGTGYTLVKRIRDAINDERSRGIMIIANSGGGSPTQAEIVYQYLSEYTSQPIEERKPVYVSIQSTCASACYYALAPADHIFAHQNSIVGSIGVRMDSWDFTEIAERLGVRRNTLTTGEHKAMMDPFTELKGEERELIMDSLMRPMHTQFVNAVVQARPGKINGEDENLFSGFIWLGDQAVENGLIDGVYTTIQVEDWIVENTGATHHRLTHRDSFSFRQLFSAGLSALASRIDGQIY